MPSGAAPRGVDDLNGNLPLKLYSEASRQAVEGGLTGGVAGIIGTRKGGHSRADHHDLPLRGVKPREKRTGEKE